MESSMATRTKNETTEEEELLIGQSVSKGPQKLRDILGLSKDELSE